MVSKKIALMKLPEEVKSHSSKWMKTKGADLKKIYWQNEYGAFSVNPAQVDTVINYIANQKEHHSKKLSRKNTGHFLKNIRLIMMSNMYGINVWASYIDEQGFTLF